MLNIQINFSSGINSALLFITCAMLKALNTFSHSHPTSVYITFGFWQKFVPLKMSCFLMETNLVKIFFLGRRAIFPVEWKKCPLFLTLCQICLGVCFAPDSVSHGLENMAPLTRAWLAKLFTPSPFPKKFFSIYLYALKMPVSSSLLLRTDR